MDNLFVKTIWFVSVRNVNKWRYIFNVIVSLFSILSIMLKIMYFLFCLLYNCSSGIKLKLENIHNRWLYLEKWCSSATNHAKREGKKFEAWKLNILEIIQILAFLLSFFLWIINETWVNMSSWCLSYCSNVVWAISKSFNEN